MIKNIIFDFDGTLVDTSKGVLEAFRETFREFAFDFSNIKDTSSLIGPPLEITFKKFFPTYDDKKIEEIADKFRLYYKKSFFKSKLYPNIISTLKIFNKMGIDLFVATNKEQKKTVKLLENFKIKKYFKKICGYDKKTKQNKSEIIKNIVGENDPSTFLMVGDSFYDYQSSLDNNINFVACFYGFGFKKGDDIKFKIKKIDSFKSLINAISLF